MSEQVSEESGGADPPAMDVFCASPGGGLVDFSGHFAVALGHKSVTLGSFAVNNLPVLVNSLAQGVCDQISMGTYTLEVRVGLSEPATHPV